MGKVYVFSFSPCLSVFCFVYQWTLSSRASCTRSIETTQGISLSVYVHAYHRRSKKKKEADLSLDSRAPLPWRESSSISRPALLHLSISTHVARLRKDTLSLSLSLSLSFFVCLVAPLSRLLVYVELPRYLRVFPSTPAYLYEEFGLLLAIAFLSLSATSSSQARADFLSLPLCLLVCIEFRSVRTWSKLWSLREEKVQRANR